MEPTKDPVKSAPPPRPPQANVWALLKPYGGATALLVACAVISNAFTLAIPKLVSSGIDAYEAHALSLGPLAWQFFAVSALAFAFAWLQGVAQTRVSERAARDLRAQLAEAVSRRSHAFVQEQTPAKLLTTFTADVDAVKHFVSQALPSIASSVVLILGAGVLLLTLDWQLALVVLLVVPLIGVTFFVVFGKVRALFMESRTVLDRLNRVINESILGAALLRVLHAEGSAGDGFHAANRAARVLGVRILKLFAFMIPTIMLAANLATLAVLWIGGREVIAGEMTLGTLAAFNGYLAMLIFPILVIGFMSSLIAQASASYQRVREVLDAPPEPPRGNETAALRGDVALRNVTVAYGERLALKDVSLEMKAGTKTAIIGPTAAGKSQLLYALTGLVHPQKGEVLYDGRPVDAYDAAALHRQIGFVFQDSVMFNLSVRENVAFGGDADEATLRKAIETAELGEFVDALPQGLDTLVSERGTSLSGGQKQRLMLARALALNPRVLLLDDFTARVDARTEASILENLARNYPGLTLISVTQKVASIEHYDQVVLLMEGELIARGTHEELLRSCPEYMQIVQSQRSTSHYELLPR